MAEVYRDFLLSTRWTELFYVSYLLEVKDNELSPTSIRLHHLSLHGSLKERNLQTGDFSGIIIQFNRFQSNLFHIYMLLYLLKSSSP